MAHEASSSSSSPFTSVYTYDVFLSFRGEDTRLGFTWNLYNALRQRGIVTFFDDEALRKGEEITPNLSKAIQESRMSIIVFSKNYAFSRFCLDELVQIHECYRKRKMEILPVFYDVDPSHVRHQNGSYEEAFAKHEGGRYKDKVEMVQKWRLALHQVANLSGSHFKIREDYEYDCITDITEDVSRKLNRRPLHIADYPVGLEFRIKQIQWLMGGEINNKVNVLGIHGIGGIGKSTLARAMYNSIAHQFEGSYFVGDVREKSSTRQGLEQIQETMLSALLWERNIKLGDVSQGIQILKDRLCRKKVLLVLDDVDNKRQLQATAGGLDWFGPGSIILITTRDKKLLDFYGNKKLYEVNELDDAEARELFSCYAFKNKDIDPNYKDQINRAVHYVRGLPLALEIIGSNLSSKSLDEWDSALKAYERIPNKDVQKILKVSYDSLEPDEKEIFLDIACYFRGGSMRYVIDMLDARGFQPKSGIPVLREKSLIKIDACFLERKIDRYDDEIVKMHDLIQSMGKEIVREQSNSPHKRNRLWFYEDIISVFDISMDNNKVEAMMLYMREGQEEVQWNQEVFGKMKNLQMLLIGKNSGIVTSPEALPSSLKVLEWWEYPAASLPSNFHSKRLVILNLSYSNFQWNEPLQNSKVLRHLILKGCKNIRRVPDISGFPSLIELCVGECTNLIEIHDSVGYLHKLQRFCAEGCTKLWICPRVVKLTSLEHLCLRDCSSLVIFPEVLAPMKKLKFVDLGGTAIKNLPLSIQNLAGLRFLSLKRCKLLESNDPSNFVLKLSQFFPNLTKLYLQNSNLTVLPECIKECRFLEDLYVYNCEKLTQIRGLPPSITNFAAGNIPVAADSSTLNMLLKQAIASTPIEYYVLPGQRIPDWFDHSRRGNSLCFWFRNELPSLTVCGVSGAWENITPPLHLSSHLFVTINGSDRCVSCMHLLHNVCISENDHLFMFNLKARHMNWSIERALKTNEWIHGKVSFEIKGPKKHSRSLGLIKWIGVYVNGEMGAISRKKDVRFTQPCPPNNTSDVGNKLVVLGEAPDIQQQQQSLALYNPKIPLGSEFEEPPLNDVSSNSDSQDRTCMIDVSSQASENVTAQQGRTSEKETSISESGDKPSQSKAKFIPNLSVPETQKKQPTPNEVKETSLSSSEEEQQVLEVPTTTTVQKSKVVHKTSSFDLDPEEKGTDFPSKEAIKEYGLSESAHAKDQREVESSKGIAEYSPMEIDDYVMKLDDDPFALLGLLSKEISISSKQSETSVQQSSTESLTTVLDELQTLAFSQPMLKNIHKVEYREKVLETTKKLDKFVDEIHNDLKMRIDSFVALFNKALKNCQQRASTIEKIDEVEEEKKESLEKLHSSKEKVDHLDDNIAGNRRKIENMETKQKVIKETMKKLQEEYDDLDKEKAKIESANTKHVSKKAEILESVKYISTSLGFNLKQLADLKRERVTYDEEFESLKESYKKMKYNPPF